MIGRTPDRCPLNEPLVASNALQRLRVPSLTPGFRLWPDAPSASREGWEKVKWLTVGLVALAVSGCVTREQVDGVLASQRPPTASEKAAIVNAARDVLFDPYSVRDAEISNVVSLGNGAEAVCVKLNSKNRVGGYTGRTANFVRLYNGRPVSLQEKAPFCLEPSLDYRKFSELEAMKNL